VASIDGMRVSPRIRLSLLNGWPNNNTTHRNASGSG
jgi:hypothetical protein